MLSDKFTILERREYQRKFFCQPHGHFHTMIWYWGLIILWLECHLRPLKIERKLWILPRLVITKICLNCDVLEQFGCTLWNKIRLSFVPAGTEMKKLGKKCAPIPNLHNVHNSSLLSNDSSNLSQFNHYKYTNTYGINVGAYNCSRGFWQWFDK